MFGKLAFDFASPAGMKGSLSVLIFHRVLPVVDPLFPEELDVERFDHLVGWLSSWFRILPLDEAVSRLTRNSLPARAAAITFDDGYADNQLLAAPILLKHGVNATFFIATGFLHGERMWNDKIIDSVRHATKADADLSFLGLGRLSLVGVLAKRDALCRIIPAVKHLLRPQREEAVARIVDACGNTAAAEGLMMNVGQVRELCSMGMGIGAHTVTHPILTRIDAAAARQEIADSRDVLADITRERVGLFAYPNGRFGTDYELAHVQIVKELGFDAAFSTNWGVSRANSDCYQLPRFTPWDRTRYRFGLRMLSNIVR
jgi:peptidoglycan/xylan/chitin deacetylase (PgdA/CDA1 family)